MRPSEAQPHPRLYAGGLTVWLADLTYTQQTVSAELIPQAIGRIAEYAETRLAFERDILLFKYPEALAEALGRFGPPDVIGFSNYIWNHSLSLAFARRIKAITPRTVVVFGGPNYPIDGQGRRKFLHDRPEIDFYVPHEGELPFILLLEALVAADGDLARMDRRDLPVHSLEPGGALLADVPPVRLVDPGVVPSPYLSGRLDEFFDGKLLPIIQTTRGCPFTCAYCVEGDPYYSRVTRFPEDLVEAEVERIAALMDKSRARGGRNDLFIADSNFGMYEQDLATCRVIAKVREKRGWPEYINVATGKNRKEIVLRAAAILGGALRISGSVQSLDPEVLANIHRDNIPVRELMNMALEGDQIGANSYCDVILALPGDSRERHFSTLEQVLDAGFNMVVTHQLMLLPGSALCTPEMRHQYGMVLRWRVLPRCHGEYEVLGERFATGETEAVCVAGNNLSFEDYLACRRMHLMIHIFNNDGMFEALTMLLRHLGRPVFRWLRRLYDSPLPSGLTGLFCDFEREAVQELWQNEQALRAWIEKPGVIERYNSGELGRNLLLTYKALALTWHMDALAEMAGESFLDYIETEGIDPGPLAGFVRDALSFHAARARDLFRAPDTEPEAILVHDIPGYLASGGGSPEVFRFEAPKVYRFALSVAQKDMIDRYLRLFGNTPTGTGRLFSKAPLKKLLRTARLVGPSSR